jgi:hypothetical protein
LPTAAPRLPEQARLYANTSETFAPSIGIPGPKNPLRYDSLYRNYASAP